MSYPGDEEETTPNWKTRYAKAELVSDKVLRFVVDSPYTAIIVVSVVIGIVALAKYLLG